MDILEILETVREVKTEAVLLNKETNKNRSAQREIDNFIKKRHEEIEEFLCADENGKGEILLKLNSEERKYFIAGLLQVLERMEKLCNALVKISFQSAEKKREYLFRETDLFSITLDLTD
jgi:hypothetical protein